MYTEAKLAFSLERRVLRYDWRGGEILKFRTGPWRTRVGLLVRVNGGRRGVILSAEQHGTVSDVYKRAVHY